MFSDSCGQFTASSRDSQYQLQLSPQDEHSSNSFLNSTPLFVLLAPTFFVISLFLSSAVYILCLAWFAYGIVFGVWTSTSLASKVQMELQKTYWNILNGQKTIQPGRLTQVYNNTLVWIAFPQEQSTEGTQPYSSTELELHATQKQLEQLEHESHIQREAAEYASQNVKILQSEFQRLQAQLQLAHAELARLKPKNNARMLAPATNHGRSSSWAPSSTIKVASFRSPKVAPQDLDVKVRLAKLDRDERWRQVVQELDNQLLVGKGLSKVE